MAYDSPIFAQTTLELWEIQGIGNESPYNNSFVRAENNIVVAVEDDFFVLQTPDERSDDIIQSSDAVFILQENTPVEIGDVVTVEGLVGESTNGITVINAENGFVSIISSNNDLPSPIIIDNIFPVQDNLDVPAWEWVEGMLIDLDNFTLTSPSDEDGFLYASPSPNRPFREAGIQYPGADNLPEWDGNPEVLFFLIDGFGLSNNFSLGAGMKLSGLGVILGEPQDYLLIPIIYSISGDYKQSSVRPKEAQEASIGNLNALFFNPFNSGYSIRIEKFANYILNRMQAPDIIAFQEVGELEALEDVAERIKELDDSQNYTAYLLKGSGSIHTGFLVKNTVSNISIQQLGENETLSLGGRKHDRPPLLLQAQFNTNPPTPISILNVHIRSLNGIEGNDQNFVRTKRHEQAISIAQMVKALQLQDENVFVVGDFNAFQFSDGYVDVLSQITGQASLGAEFDVEEVIDLPLVNHSLSVAPEEQYSFIFQGNAQILDHCLSSSSLNQMTVDELQYVRGNADSPEQFLETDPNLRVSDHDGFVVFLDMEDTLSVVSAPSNPSPIFEQEITYPNPFQLGDDIIFNLVQKENLSYQLVALNGVIVETGNLGAIENDRISLELPNSIVDGIYILKIAGNNTDFVGKVFIKR